MTNSSFIISHLYFSISWESDFLQHMLQYKVLDQLSKNQFYKVEFSGVN